MGTQKGKLFELASMFNTYRKNKATAVSTRKGSARKTVEAKGQHFDEGKAITLTYNLDMYPEVLKDSHNRQAVAMNMWETDHSEAFYVEPFEAEETVEVSYREADASGDDARLDRIVTGLGKQSDELDEMTKDEEKLGEMESKLDKMFQPDEDESEALAMQSVTEVADETEPEIETQQSSPPSVDTDDNAVVTPTAQSYSYDASDEEFARDIGAILKGQKAYDTDQKKTVEKHVPAEVQKTGKEHEDVLDLGKNEHKIFEKIAQSMAYANSYDLGAIALEEKFQLMDQELEKEEVNSILEKKVSANAPSGKIEYANVVDDKEEVGKAMATPKYNVAVALDPGNGGRYVSAGNLQPGDLLLEREAGAAGGELQSVAAVYAGNGKVITMGGAESIEERPIEQKIGSGTVVVLRHQTMDGKKASAIIDVLGKATAAPGEQTDKRISVRIPTVSLHASVCNDLPPEERAQCSAFSGKIRLGTPDNDSFVCPEPVIKAFAGNQLEFVSPLTNDHNGSLKYFGHLK
jgi:hypothetical protein